MSGLKAVAHNGQTATEQLAFLSYKTSDVDDIGGASGGDDKKQLSFAEFERTFGHLAVAVPRAKTAVTPPPVGGEAPLSGGGGGGEGQPGRCASVSHRVCAPF
jgi:hypothetical protein|eukprot:COSAG01_NODE_7543_length_3158_cov_1.837856_7_plen_103_part_00